MTRTKLLLPVALLLVAVLATTASMADETSKGPAAEEQPHPQLRDFYPTGEFDYVVGERVTDAVILLSRRAAAYLVQPAGTTDTYLLLQGKRTVSKVKGVPLKAKDGHVHLPKEAELQALGTFEAKAGGIIVIRADPLRAELRPRPALTGTKTPDAVRAHSPQYGLIASAYRTDKTSIQRLQAAKDVKVEVIFGSWCPRCQQTMGNALRIESELKSGGATWVFHGLPAPPAAWKDKRFLQTKTKALPTAIVWLGDKLVGRVPPADWKRLDVAVARLLK